MPTHGDDEPERQRRRKKPDVAVHRSVPDVVDKKVHKTYSANFNSRRYRHKVEEAVTDDADSPRSHHHRHEVPEHDHADRVGKKQLKKENARMLKENQLLVDRFDQLEDLSSKKIAKLRDKIQALQELNGEVVNENALLKEQYQNLSDVYETLRLEHESCKFCKSCQEFQRSLEVCLQENGALKISNAEMSEDVKMLKTVVYRLNVQMERYQEKLRKSNIRTMNTLKTFQLSTEDTSKEEQTIIATALSEHHLGHIHTPLSWGKVNTHTLGPLLDAYQDTIAEKEEIIQAYEAELSSFTGKLKQVIKENELLYSRLTEDDECSARLKVDVESLRKELKSVKDHNDILIKKCSLKQDKIEELLKCYESKVEQLTRDYNVAHEQYCQGRNEIAALREKNRALIDAQDDFKTERQNYIPVSVHTASVNECKKWYEELKFQYESEKRKLKENLESQNKIIEDLQNKIGLLNNEKEELCNRVKHFKEQLKKTEAKHLELEHALHEAQLAKTTCRKQLNKAMSFAKDLVAEQEVLLKVLNERQKENKAVKRIGSEMATRMDCLKSQLKTVQKDAWQELTTVERRIEEQNDVIENMKEEHRLEVERLTSIIKQQEDSSLLLKGQTSIPLPHYLLLRDKNKQNT